jgi:hypothetical protein
LKSRELLKVLDRSAFAKTTMQMVPSFERP